MSTATTTLPSSAAVHEEAGAKKSRKKLMIGVVLLLALLGGGGFAAKTFLLAPAEPGPDPRTVAGEVVTLDPVTLNLADGRYLKVALALQLSEAASPASGSVDAAAATGPAVDGAKALDAAISVLGQRTYAQLIAPGGRAAAQEALSAAVKKRYDGDVLGVYFTQFLMQ